MKRTQTTTFKRMALHNVSRYLPGLTLPKAFPAWLGVRCSSGVRSRIYMFPCLVAALFVISASGDDTRRVEKPTEETQCWWVATGQKTPSSIGQEISVHQHLRDACES